MVVCHCDKQDAIVNFHQDERLTPRRFIVIWVYFLRHYLPIGLEYNLGVRLLDNITWTMVRCRGSLYDNMACKEQ